MKSRLSLLVLVVATLIASRFVGSTRETVASPVTEISGPFSHENLTIFLLHGRDEIRNRKIVTLGEALDQKLAMVHETGSVNELLVENLSTDSELFLQSGDIVKGGRQDRLIAADVLLPPKSGRVPVASFCCESGRWQQRGNEAATHFGANPGNANTKSLKLAVNDAKQQAAVWANVQELQNKVNHNLNTVVNSPQSPTSLQLAIENKQLQDRIAAYEKALSVAFKGQTNVIGFAIAINGKVEGAEIYGSAALFAKARPKLLTAAAIDAIAEWKKDQRFPVSAESDVRTFMDRTLQSRRTDAIASARPRPQSYKPQGTSITGAFQSRFNPNMPDRNDMNRMEQTAVLEVNGRGDQPEITRRTMPARPSSSSASRSSRSRYVNIQGQQQEQLAIPQPNAPTTNLPSLAAPAVSSPAARLNVTQRGNHDAIMVESRDNNRGGAVVRQSFTAK
jgi:hypothetical protein